MANPQKENGYTVIANEIMEALCSFRIPGECRQILDCVFRKTYGFHKTEDWISNSQMIEMTGMKKGNASRALSKLITNKLVIQSDNKLRLNKNYQEWVSFKSLSKVITGKKNRVVIQSATPVIKLDTTVIQSDNKLLSKVRDTKDNKDNTTKETITKDNNANALIKYGNSDINELHSYLKEKLGLPLLDGSIQINRNFANLCIRKFGFEKTKLAIDASAQSSFWKTQITSFRSLYNNAIKIVKSMQNERRAIDATNL